ncbi:hypothetical protein TI04_10320, partial [Achromatium sp. WMS2]
MKPDYAGRRRLLLGILGVGLIALLWSTANRQIIQRDYLEIQGKHRYLREIPIPAHRGEISDRHGEPLAISSSMFSVWVDPRHLPNSPKFTASLASLIETPLAELQTLLTKNKDKGFVYVKKNLSPDRGDQVKALFERYRLGSAGLEQEYRRYYPSGEVTAHIIGITNAEDRGQEGVEKTQDAVLAGKPGLRIVMQDGQRRVVEEVGLVRPPEPGRPLTLSIDRRLQFLAYLELKRAVIENKAVGATAVILDAQTSEILAMVNQPSFNPNDRAKLTPAAMRNRAIID